MDLESITFRRRAPLRLQLAPMIDIFTLLIIFLLKSTVVADISIIFPSGFVPPKSLNQESLETFPEVFVYNDRIELPFVEEKHFLNTLESLSSAEIHKIRNKVFNYIKAAEGENKQHVVNVNILSSRDNSYKNIFESVKFLRQIGFQSVLFIAEGERQQ